MARLLETASGLAIAYPPWLALLAVAGAALLVYVARPGGAQVKGRWPLAAASCILIFAGIYFVTYRVTLTPESGRVYAFPLQNDRMAWSDARMAAVMMRVRGKGGPKPFLVVVDGAQRELEIPLAALDAAERKRVVDYVGARVVAK